MKSLVVVACLVFANLCEAGTDWNFGDGNGLLQGIAASKKMDAVGGAALTEEERMKALATLAYLRGFHEASIIWSQTDPKSPFTLPEKGMPTSQFIQVIEKSLTDNPEHLHLPSWGLILKALIKNFPNPANPALEKK